MINRADRSGAAAGSSAAFLFSDLETFVVSKHAPPPAAEVLASFRELPDDQYLQGHHKFRKRVFAHGTLSVEGIQWSSGTEFFQSRTINEYAGGVKRVFAPASEAIREYFWGVLQSPFYRIGLGDGRYHFGLHQIRIVCDDMHEGHPVPEGYHQDGFDFVAIHTFHRANVLGGGSYLREGSIGGPCIFERDLAPGEILLFNDRRLFHYATPVRNVAPGTGCRDICVLTFTLIE